MSTKNAKSYYVLSNEEGTILGVYGSALADMAETRGREIKGEVGARVALHSITSNSQPRVGDSISMKGNVRYL